MLLLRWQRQYLLLLFQLLLSRSNLLHPLFSIKGNRFVHVSKSSFFYSAVTACIRGGAAVPPLGYVETPNLSQHVKQGVEPRVLPLSM